MPQFETLTPKNTARGAHNWLCDLLFLLFAACYAFLAHDGIMPVSGMGARIDSDLETYAQGMAGEYNRRLFANDPVLHDTSPANSIKNAERMLAGALTRDYAYARGLLSAGAIAIFIFYAGWYALGRWLSGSPCLAACLALLNGITVWIGWGTFWGVTHSDPVPRVFFAAAFPCLLILAVSALKNQGLRPLVMLACGLSMWIHGISALNCGAMFFLAFLFHKPHNRAWLRHFFNCGLCLAAFFVPVAYFLWPSLKQAQNFTTGELAVFQELFNLRFHEDFFGFGPRICQFISPTGFVFWLLLSGLVCWLITRYRGGNREKTLCAMCPAFVLALGAVAAFCWAETKFAPMFGRLPMGHELVRGLRFLVPLAWLMIVAGIGSLLGKNARRLCLAALCVGLLVFSVDRQYAAAQYSLARMLHVDLPQAARAEKQAENSRLYLEMLEELKNTVPPGETVFSDNDDMAIRYHALRPLAHAFKDGYIFFYNKDLEGSRRWLRYEKLIHSGEDGYIMAWLESGAPWLLSKNRESAPLLQEKARLVWSKNGWSLYRRSR